MTKTPETEREYRYRFGLIAKRIMHEFSVPEVTARSALRHLEMVRQELSHPAFRKQKAALLFCLREKGVAEEELAEVEGVGYRAEDLEAYRLRLAGGSAGASAYKSKGITDADLKKIIKELRASFSEDDVMELDDYAEGVSNSGMNWIVFIYLYFSTNKHLGLRPMEIVGLVIEESDEEISVIAKNSKNTNNRAIGSERRIIIDKKEFDKENGAGESDKLFGRLQLLSMAADRHTIKRGKNSLYWGMYSAFRKFIQNRMPHLRKRKNKITLYSVRHHFIAAARKAGLNRLEIAALVGHASDLTASVHYGGVPIKRRGSAVGVKPDKEIVSQVRAVYERSKGKTKKREMSQRAGR